MEVALGGLCSIPCLPEYDSDDEHGDISTKGMVLPPSHLINQRAMWLEQQQIGQITFTPNSRRLLRDMLDEVYSQLQPKQTDWDARQIVIQFITKLVIHRIPGSSITAFGSFVMDLFMSSSDLDLSINLANGRCDCSHDDKIHYLRKVAKALYNLQNRQQSVQKIETVYRAAVPVVKFIECKTGIQCDIAVESNDGVLKSQVLGMVTTMDSRFRQLCYLVKAWAKKHNVNSSKTGTLNSLSICLLVAFHLQTRSPAILPAFSVFMNGLHLLEIGSCLQTVEGRVREYKDRGFGKDNTESVPELFGSFFLKLLSVESLWGQGLCSSTYEGRWVSKIWPKNHIGCISVEDFVDPTQNVARSVAQKGFNLIYQVLQSTVSNLKDPVYDVLEAKLFGSIRQWYGSSSHGMSALNTGTWQNGNGWSQPSHERRSIVPSSGRHENLAEGSLYTDGAWGLVHIEHSQAGHGPVQRGSGYRKGGQSARIAKVRGSGFDTNGQGENRGLHHSHRSSVHGCLMKHPPLDFRSNPFMDNMKQVAVNPSSGYRDSGSVCKDLDSGYRKEDRLTKLNSRASDPSFSGGGFIYREVDFPTLDEEKRAQYPEANIPVEPHTVFAGYAEFVEQSEMSYSGVRRKPRSHYVSPAPVISTGARQNQGTEYRYNHPRAWRNQPTGSR